ncbi:MAG: insulinase family protein [Bacteroidales bacterium]|jgi:predicted Zn-dependent peptidase|nr:insulinase family protein [Bacteroidales bacterium]
MKTNNIKLPSLKPEMANLDNQTPFAYFNNKEMNVVRLEFMFGNASKVHQNKPFVAMTANAMLTEGTENFTAFQIAEAFDYFGAFIERVANAESSSIVFYFLKKHAQRIIPYIEETILRPNFPENELNIANERHKQQQQINEQKTGFIASNKFYKSIFPSHPYGLVGTAQDFDLLNQNDISTFYDDFMAQQNALTIIASGNIDDSFIALVNRSIGSSPRKQKTMQQTIEIPQYIPQTELLKVNMAAANQVSLRLGKQTVSYNSEEYLPLKVLNCVFGGYFGSRLMSNIREQKGLSYGINSSLFTYSNVGVISVSADVKASEYELAIKEIMKEMKALQSEKVESDELNRVKNYLKGEILRSLDGSFDLGERYGYLISRGISTDYFSNYLDVVNSITAEDLQHLASTYLTPESFTCVAVGKV